jgi:hypothetical protein
LSDPSIRAAVSIACSIMGMLDFVFGLCRDLAATNAAIIVGIGS